MQLLSVNNPFCAPVYHEETVSSTMDISRLLSARGEPHGTVISADFQEKGRGRFKERSWVVERGKSLLFTILLRYSGIEEIPTALTLRTGLAVALAVEDFAPSLSGKVKIKWPNDILIDSKKIAGILAEADGGNVHIGIGVNAAQNEFPLYLREKAVSIGMAAGAGEIESAKRFVLLEKILSLLYDEIKTDDGGVSENGRHRLRHSLWLERIEQRLFKKGEAVCFKTVSGTVCGTLCGIGHGGGLLLTPDGEKTVR